MFRTIALSATLLASPLFAHEFWIEGGDHTVAVGETITGDIRVGSELSGTRQPYRPDRFRRFEYYQNGVSQEVGGRLGDLPALSLDGASPGLVSIIHHSGQSILTYRDETLLERYLATEGLDHLMARHLERGLPLTGFMESYSRQAKALYAVGDGEGSDQFTGMPFEMVALDNPYTLEGPVRVRLLLDGRPYPDAPVNLFHRVDGEGVQVRLRTNAEGVFTVDHTEPGTVLLNSVYLFETDARSLSQPVWESYWASLIWRRD
ncbi:DUF4198 domain-containing protein [Pontivivens insulae]|uniref:Nickel uptake substrate-specific transmembrane region n=1 Tax=Pontivivens insulae TaxID=1639689 RepID=A0A2R8ACI9_9RHOB|nr:DUF4198 domain-containing protein [Pontivivens insulae]RED11020.1 uncharacterized protein DUF4198 [Pontivivens insulae]SPF29805.1 hypothetical protein POI8812_02123 [Pontivivens insulae]